MPKPDRRRGIGGDQEGLSPFTTSDPVPETIVRRGEDGYIRASALQITDGIVQIGPTVQLVLPPDMPPDEYFLRHAGNGVLEWVPAAALSGTIDWSQIVGTPVTLAGYGISDAYTRAQIDAFFNPLEVDQIDEKTPSAGITMLARLHVDVNADVDLVDDIATLVLGAKGGQHMELDDNEIAAKDDTTTVGTLGVQVDGNGVNGVFFSGAGQNAFQGFLAEDDIRPFTLTTPHGVLVEGVLLDDYAKFVSR